jgi:hypothetical protein
VPQLHEDSAKFIFDQGNIPPYVGASILMDLTGTNEDEGPYVETLFCQQM